MTFLLSCDRPESRVEHLALPNIMGEKNWESVSKEGVRAYFFLSPECPLCQNYSKAMRDLYGEFGHEVQFAAVFPGRAYSEKDIRKYLIQYRLEFPAFHDPEFEFTELMGAEITPEVFVVNAANETLYSGAIDNWAISLGQKRSVVTENYLRDALHAINQNQEITLGHQKAVGCFIQ